MKKLAYRACRNPILIFLIAPLTMFVFKLRVPPPEAPLNARMSTYWTDLGLIGIFYLAHITIGLKAFLLVQIPSMAVAGTAGVWLFYIQHQFEGVYWERGERWDFTRAALEGSSYYKLTRALQWFTGNIGFHHIHHLNARIPNYLLEKCHKEVEACKKVKPVTLFKSLKAISFHLWDEENRRLVGFKYLRQFRMQRRLH